METQHTSLLLTTTSEEKYRMDVIVIGVFIDLWLESFHISQASKMG